MLPLFSFMDFSLFMCIVIEVWILGSVRWDEEDVSTLDKEDGFSVVKGAEQERLR